jgi:phosphatidylglycerophosphatase A
VNLPRLIAGGFGCGRAPVAPGTVASAVAALLGAGLLSVSPWALAAGTVLATVGGVWAIRASAIENDPGWVVIDEVAGQWLTLLGLAVPTVPGVLAAFLLFRLLDIAKPGPIGWADRHRGPMAVMGDDAIAGVIGGFVMLGLRLAWPTLLD